MVLRTIATIEFISLRLDIPHESSFFGPVELAIYAALATAIAALGLYGLTAGSVSRRTRELAIRIAVGAERRDLIGVILREAMVLGGMGTGCVKCHEEETPSIVSDWRLSTHSQNDVGCRACHGSNVHCGMCRGEDNGVRMPTSSSTTS